MAKSESFQKRIRHSTPAFSLLKVVPFSKVFEASANELFSPTDIV